MCALDFYTSTFSGPTGDAKILSWPAREISFSHLFVLKTEKGVEFEKIFLWVVGPGTPHPYVGTENIVERGGPKIVTWWRLKIWLQEGDKFMGQGVGREGELLKKMTKK